jgi:hypothetical protein
MRWQQAISYKNIPEQKRVNHRNKHGSKCGDVKKDTM